MGDRPTGTVTFLFTDIEGSTGMWEEATVAMQAAQARHDKILHAAIERCGGYVFSIAGDGFAAAFQSARDGVAGAIAVQADLAAEPWDESTQIRVRMGLHLGEVEERDDDYFGPTLNRTARLMATGHGGQILCSEEIASLVDVPTTDLGEHRLRDLSSTMRIFQVDADGHVEFPALRTESSGSNLPAPITRLVGREEDVRAVRSLLEHHRLVTVAASGGIGKTRLAIEVGERELPRWRHGVWFADLSKASDDRDVAPAIAAALRMESRSTESKREIADYLASRTLLLIVDNCEHLIDECADVLATILAAGGSSAVLATSRQWLDIGGEHVFRLRPLSVDDPDGAIRLFEERAMAVKPEFEIDDTNRDDVHELCRRVDGVPLAIELAAARIAVLEPADLVAGLDDRFRLLSGGRRRQRQRTLEATIDWSYDLLEPDEQVAFRCLSVFAGSFDLNAAAAVCATPRPELIDLVESLLAHSLVTVAEEGAGRFRLLDTLKAYADDRLLDESDTQDLRERHAQHFLGRARIDDFEASLSTERRSEMLPDRSNLNFAADWFESADRWDQLAELLPGSVALDAADTPVHLARVQRCRSHVATPALIDGLLVAENYLQLIVADWGGYMDSSLLMRASNDPLVAARGYLFLAIPTARSDPDAAYAVIDRGLEKAGRLADDDLRRQAETLRAIVACFANDLDRARRHAEALNTGPKTTLLGTERAGRILAMDAWARGDVAALRAAVDASDDQAGAQLDVFTGMSDHYQRALLAVAEDADDAPQQVERYALDAASGRWAALASGALGLLAATEARAGNDDLARDLIRSTGAQRGAYDVVVIRTVARRLGIEAQHEAEFARRVFDPDWLVERPSRALDAELARRSWTDSDRPVTGGLGRRARGAR